MNTTRAMAAAHRLRIFPGLRPVLRRLAVALTAFAIPLPLAFAPAAATAAEAEHSLQQWLLSLQQTPCGGSYAGTFIVSSTSGDLASARIWHVCDGAHQLERVDSLTGTPRTTIRRDDEVTTYWPQTKVARQERQATIGQFPHPFHGPDGAVDDFYRLSTHGQDRVAGFDTEVVQLTPKDGYRFGYRVWRETQRGLIVKMQTLGTDGRVLEQAAFSELRLDEPMPSERWMAGVNGFSGYRVERQAPSQTTPAAEGWRLRQQVPGFHAVNCYRRLPAAGATPVVQWVFSDGLAAVSLFVEAYDGKRHRHEGALAMGATMTLTRRITDGAQAWWLTVVGEVPHRTLVAFADRLQRQR